MSLGKNIVNFLQILCHGFRDLVNLFDISLFLLFRFVNEQRENRAVGCRVNHLKRELVAHFVEEAIPSDTKIVVHDELYLVRLVEKRVVLGDICLLNAIAVSGTLETVGGFLTFLKSWPVGLRPSRRQPLRHGRQAEDCRQCGN